MPIYLDICHSTSFQILVSSNARACKSKLIIYNFIPICLMRLAYRDQRAQLAFEFLIVRGRSQKAVKVLAQPRTDVSEESQETRDVAGWYDLSAGRRSTCACTVMQSGCKVTASVGVLKA